MIYGFALSLFDKHMQMPLSATIALCVLLLPSLIYIHELCMKYLHSTCESTHKKANYQGN